MRELDRFKMKEEQEKKELLLKKEMELQKLKEEKRAEQEQERLKKEKAAAVEKYKIEEMEKASKAKKEREEREKEYQERLEADMRMLGIDGRQMAHLAKKETSSSDCGRPTYTRMARRYLSLETLNAFQIEFQYDANPEFIIIKRPVPQWEQDRLWQHTKHIREARDPVYITIEEGKKYHRKEPELEFVREKHKRHERRPSPSPPLAWVAGARP